VPSWPCQSWHASSASESQSQLQRASAAGSQSILTVHWVICNLNFTPFFTPGCSTHASKAKAAAFRGTLRYHREGRRRCRRADMAVWGISCAGGLIWQYGGSAAPEGREQPEWWPAATDTDIGRQRSAAARAGWGRPRPTAARATSSATCRVGSALPLLGPRPQQSGPDDCWGFWDLGDQRPAATTTTTTCCCLLLGGKAAVEKKESGEERGSNLRKGSWSWHWHGWPDDQRPGGQPLSAVRCPALFSF
jgi:hypothetical protein